ncbi:MAG: alkanesulfonate monooxygenase SsuD [Gammaproteobacteria bacterium]|jgi:alkanesulfonate monooxygenase SsuD/methylene tetrahydromethanopterin reductase-like flavin-dependent oxidoreductase (luciferase family)
MEFGITIAPHIQGWDQIKTAEDLGYDRAWVPDSQMIWSDCYAILALAAVNTKTINIGTGVSIAGTRIAPVTAHSIASINQLAPGRTFLGIGTGHTAMRVMGQDPMPVSEFREYLRVVRGLLDGEAVDYTYRGNTREIEFLHRDRYFVNLDNRIPIYVAGNGPKACQAAGTYGDGWTTIGRDTVQLGKSLAHISNGAKASGRTLPQDFHTTLFTSTSVLRRGEDLKSERVINEVGSWVTTELHFFYEIWNKLGRTDDLIPPHFLNMWDEYLARVEGFSLPENARFRQIHDGHAIYLVPQERRFVTPAAISAICMVGSAEDIIDQIRTVESAGIKEINIMPATDHAAGAFKDFAEQIIPAFR